MTLLLSTAYLPPISYISLFLQNRKLVIERFETYPKQTFRNHCRIYGPNGQLTLSVPVIKVNGNHTLTKDIRIASTNWQRLHWRSIETAYNNSPFFLYYKDEFAKVFDEKHEFLLDLNSRLLEIILTVLRIDPDILYSEQYEQNPAEMKDMRESGIKRNKQQDHLLPEYTQVFSPKHGFLSDLSIIDLIFNLGPESYDYLDSEKNPIFALR